MQLFNPDNHEIPRDFDELVDDFRWEIPARFNFAEAVCERHADGSARLALIAAGESTDAVYYYTFDEINAVANRLANWFVANGVGRGDRVAAILPQRVETALVHVAAHKAGAVSLPLSVLFREDALLHRLRDSAAMVVITDPAHAPLIHSLREQLPALQHVLICGRDPARQTTDESPRPGAVPEARMPVDADEPDSFWTALATQSAQFECVDTHADDPALLIYTSGTTGPPKGALIAHRSLIGNLTGFELSMNFFPEPDDIFYTPADWAWTGGLLDGLMPTWYYGMPVLGYESGKFNPEKTLKLLESHRVTCGFFPPTALKMLRSVNDIPKHYQLHLRAIMSAGEMVGEELVHWAEQELGVLINEMYGQTEQNYMVGNCSAIMPPRPGSMGKAYPGHRVEFLTSNGSFAVAGEQGEIVACAADAVHFLGYWQQPGATERKYTVVDGEKWFHTGDVGYRDEDGFLWFVGRVDDVISSAGYRIGPGEIEDCLLRHPAVLQAAVIGVPDPDGIRGDVVKAYLVLNNNVKDSDNLRNDIQQWVKNNLAAYEYPRLLEVLDELPMTTTGKVRRVDLRERHLQQYPT